MDRDLALLVKSKALDAILLLNSIMSYQCDWGDVSLKDLKKGIGLSIGSIDLDLLCVVYKKYPDLDDLKNTPD